MAVLLIAEVTKGELDVDATAKALSAAKQLGDVSILVAGDSTQNACVAAAQLDGVTRVLKADSPLLGHQLAETYAELILGLSKDYDHIVAPATTTAKNVMPRLAALLDVMILSDVTRVVDASTFERPIYAGNANQVVRSKDNKKVITFRVTSFEASVQGGSAVIEDIAVGESANLSDWVRDRVVESDRPDLSSAKVVVSGGRGVGSADGFEMIEALADKLGAAVGASRAAVDSGYAQNDWQVGQTGKVVAPELYIAVGISGAIQHLAGMKDSKIIVAINKDEEAPIFQVADFGLVADLFQAVPELIEEI